MSIRGMFDLDVRIWTHDDVPDALGDVDQMPTVKGGPYRATLQFVRGTNRDQGTGGASEAIALLFIEARAQIAENDIVQILVGPNAGTWWEALPVFEPSRAKHKEVKLQAYLGKHP